MSSARLWKSVAGMAGAAALVLAGAGVAGAATVAPTHTARSSVSADDNPVPDCHSAEHAGFGALINCQGEQKPGSPAH